MSIDQEIHVRVRPVANGFKAMAFTDEMSAFGTGRTINEAIANALVLISERVRELTFPLVTPTMRRDE